MARSSGKFTAFSFIWRLVAALVLVLATYNPTEHSFVDWVYRDLTTSGVEATNTTLKVVVGIVLLIGWTILLVATRSSLGTLGVLLGVALLAALVWLLIDIGWLSLEGDNAQWIILVCLGFLLAMGLSWSHMWRRLTGQVDITDDDQ
jgi:hypothetical protein